MKTKYSLNLNGNLVTVIGEVIDNNSLRLSYLNGEIIGIVNSHKDDLDSIQREFCKLSSSAPIIEKIIEPIDVIKGLENIIQKYPETKSRLASLKSQVYNVLTKNHVLD